MFEIKEDFRNSIRHEVVDKFNSGATMSAISNELKVNRHQIKRILQDEELYSKRVKVGKDMIDELINMYNSGMTIREISEKTSLTYDSVRRRLSECQVEFRSKFDYSAIKCNQNFFEVITPKSAYWAGFIVGDGCIFEKRNSSKLGGITIGLKASDEEFLGRFKEDIEFEGSLRFNKDKSAVVITISSEKIANDLRKIYNITPRKSLTYNPILKIPEEYHKYFLLGIFDADGCITSTQQSGRSIRTYSMSITGTKETLEFAQQFFGTELRLLKRRKDNSNNYTLIINGNKQVLKKLKMLYSEDIVETCLKRKYYRFLELEKQSK